MELKRDDWVKTESGETGRVVHISRLTVFVAIIVACNEDRMEAFLESQLTKIERPGQSQSTQRIGVATKSLVLALRRRHHLFRRHS